MICDELVSIPGASQILLGGFVTYTDEMKKAVLHVPAEVLKEHGAR